MIATLETPSPSYLMRLLRSRWLLTLATLVPAVVAVAGTLHLVNEVSNLQKQRNDLEDRIQDLQTAADTTKREMSAAQQISADAQLEAKAARLAIEQERAALEKATEENKRLEKSLSFTDAAVAIAGVRTNMRTQTPRARATELLRQGQLARGKGNPEVARLLYLAAIGEDAKFSEPLIVLGAMAYDEGDKREAESRFKAALDLDPRSPFAQMDLLEFYTKESRLAEGGPLLDQLRAIPQSTWPPGASSRVEAYVKAVERKTCPTGTLKDAHGACNALHTPPLVPSNGPTPKSPPSAAPPVAPAPKLDVSHASSSPHGGTSAGH